MSTLAGYERGRDDAGQRRSSPDVVQVLSDFDSDDSICSFLEARSDDQLARSELIATPVIVGGKPCSEAK